MNKCCYDITTKISYYCLVFLMTQYQHLFPITLAAHWCSEPEQLLTSTLSNWLFDPTSLTARLKKHCKNFRVEVVGQHIEKCSAEEAKATIHAGEQVLVREVILYCDEQAQVFARSLLPLSSLTGEQQKLANLGTQPLGQVLFNDPKLDRQSIEIASFGQQSSVGQFCANVNLSNTHDLWGRRSLFVLNNKPIMVAEVFLPNSFAYKDGVFAE